MGVYFDRKINILYLITSSGIGGSEQNLYRLAVWMRNQGFGVQVCCLRERGMNARRLEEEGIPVTCFNEPEKPTAIGFFRSILKLRRIINESKIDLVHSFLLRANIEARIVKRLSLRPFALINTQHGISLKKPRSYTFIDRFTSQWYDFFLANSNAVKHFLLAREYIPADKVKIIYHGVDTTKFKPRYISNSNLEVNPLVQSNSMVIGYVGRLHPVKGVRYLIEATYLANQQMNGFKLVIVGDGIEGPHLKDLVKKYHMENRVCFLGVREDIAYILPLFDILVLPSLEEGFPTIVLEALASGVPIIATAVGGTVEVIDHGITGLLVPPADVSSLSDSMQQLLKDETLKQQLAVNGRRLVTQKFRNDNELYEIRKLYEEALVSCKGHIHSS